MLLLRRSRGRGLCTSGPGARAPHRRALSSVCPSPPQCGRASRTAPSTPTSRTGSGDCFATYSPCFLKIFEFVYGSALLQYKTFIQKLYHLRGGKTMQMQKSPVLDFLVGLDFLRFVWSDCRTVVRLSSGDCRTFAELRWSWLSRLRACARRQRAARCRARCPRAWRILLGCD